MAVTNFIWDVLSDNVLMETDGNDLVVVDYTTKPDQFGEVLSQHQHGVDHFFNYDGLGSTRNLTRQDQVVSDSYTYSAFGDTVASSGPTPNPFKFNGAHGYYTNSETNDIYVRRRTYNPSLARWLSRDPLGFIDGPNVYLYVKNSVPNRIDPSGLIKFVVVDKFLSPQAKCGDVHFAEYAMRLTGGSPCQGYFVQKVTYEGQLAACPDELPPMEERVFWEAWPMWDVGRVYPYLMKTDTFAYEHAQDTHGEFNAVGEMRFYCVNNTQEYGLGTGDLGTYGHPPSHPEDSDWRPGNENGLPWAGELPTSHNKPTWWDDSTPVEGPIRRFMNNFWDCCPCREEISISQAFWG